MRSGTLDYAKAIGHRWYVLVVSVAGGLLGVGDAVLGRDDTARVLTSGDVQIVEHPLVPTWVWVSLIVSGLFAAQVWAWFDMRHERDVALAEVDTRAANERLRVERDVMLAGYAKTFGELRGRTVASDAELDAFIEELDANYNAALQWIAANISQSAAERLGNLDRTGEVHHGVPGAYNDKHANVLLNLSKIRSNLDVLTREVVG